MSFFVGLDLGLGATGVTKLGGGEDRVWSIKIKVKTGEADVADPARMLEIMSQIRTLVTQPGCEGVAVEGFSFASKSQSHKIGGLGWLVRAMLHEEPIRTIIVPPNTLKLFTTGKGESAKGVMIKEVYKRWGVDVSSDDEADSYALAVMARHFFTPILPALPYQVRALEGVELLPLRPRFRERRRTG